MKRRKPNLSPIRASNANTEILRLQTELYIARDTVLKLIAPTSRNALVGAAYSLDPSEFNLGVSDAAEAISARAKPLPPRAIAGVTDPSERGRLHYVEQAPFKPGTSPWIRVTRWTAEAPGGSWQSPAMSGLLDGS